MSFIFWNIRDLVNYVDALYTKRDFIFSTNCSRKLFCKRARKTTDTSALVQCCGDTNSSAGKTGHEGFLRGSVVHWCPRDSVCHGVHGKMEAGFITGFIYWQIPFSQKGRTVNYTKLHPIRHGRRQ